MKGAAHDKLGSGTTASGGVAVPDGPRPESQAARVGLDPLMGRCEPPQACW